MRSTKVTVKGQKYRVVFQENMEAGGLNFPAEKIIVINKSFSVEEQMDALVHELLHALFQENSWDKAMNCITLEELMTYELTKFFFSLHKALKAFEKK